MHQSHVQLNPYRVGSDDRLWVEQAVPFAKGKQQYIVGWRLRCGSGGHPHGLDH